MLVVLTNWWTTTYYWLFYLCHFRDMSSKEGPLVLVEPFGLWRLMFILSFFVRNYNISFWMEFCKRGVLEKSWMNSSNFEEYRFVGKSWRDSYTGWILLISSPFLLVLLLKRKNKNHLWILWHCSWAEKDYFLLSRGLKFVYVF